MKKTMARTITAAIGISMLIAGCNKTVSKPVDTTKVDNTPIHIKMYTHYDWAQDSGAPDPEKYPLVKYLKEKKNVTYEFISSNGNADQKLSTMLASNDLPDLIMTDRGTTVERLRKAGKLIALDDNFKKYPNFQKQVPKTTWGMLASSDGKHYQMPDWYVAPGGFGGNSGWVLQGKIYQEMGSPKVDTLDEMEKYLRDVKAKYPSIIPLDPGAGQDVSVMGFIWAGMGEEREAGWLGANNRYYVDKNEVKSLVSDPTFKDAMHMSNRWFRDKLITQDAMTQKTEQFEEKLANGKAAVWTQGDILGQGTKNLDLWKKKDPQADYKVIMPPHTQGLDASKIKLQGWNVLGWNVSIITTSCKNPEKLYAYCDWQTGPEGSSLNTFGPKGQYWTELDSNGLPNTSPDFFKLGDSDKAKLTDKKGAGVAFLNFGNKSDEKFATPEEKAKWAYKAQHEILSKTLREDTDLNALQPDPQSEESQIRTKTEDMWKQSLAKILFAKNDVEVDNIIAKLTDDLNKAGNDKLMKLYNKIWEENKKAMGVK